MEATADVNEPSAAGSDSRKYKKSSTPVDATTSLNAADNRASLVSSDERDQLEETKRELLSGEDSAI